jgi:hypothetical protein
VPTIAAIAEAESGGNPAASCVDCVPGIREDSLGLTQINVDAHPDAASLDLFDPVTNLEEALKVSGGGTNFTPWSTFTSGAYKSFLPDAGSAGATGTLVGTTINPADPWGLIPGDKNILGPLTGGNNPISGAINSGASSVGKDIAGAIGPILLKGVFLFGGVALVVAGVWRAANGTGMAQRVAGSAQQVGTLAAVAA